MLDELQQRQNIFLSYDLKTIESRVSEGQGARGDTTEVQIERFHNKDLNFSISWYPDLKALYQWTIERQVAELEKLRDEQLKAK